MSKKMKIRIRNNDLGTDGMFHPIPKVDNTEGTEGGETMSPEDVALLGGQTRVDLSKIEAGVCPGTGKAWLYGIRFRDYFPDGGYSIVNPMDGNPMGDPSQEADQEESQRQTWEARGCWRQVGFVEEKLEEILDDMALPMSLMAWMRREIFRMSTTEMLNHIVVEAAKEKNFISKGRSKLEWWVDLWRKAINSCDEQEGVGREPGEMPDLFRSYSPDPACDGLWREKAGDFNPPDLPEAILNQAREDLLVLRTRTKALAKMAKGPRKEAAKTMRDWLVEWRPLTPYHILHKLVGAAVVLLKRLPGENFRLLKAVGFLLDLADQKGNALVPVNRERGNTIWAVAKGKEPERFFLKRQEAVGYWKMMARTGRYLLNGEPRPKRVPVYNHPLRWEEVPGGVALEPKKRYNSPFFGIRGCSVSERQEFVSYLPLHWELVNSMYLKALEEERIFDKPISFSDGAVGYKDGTWEEVAIMLDGSMNPRLDDGAWKR